jgi:hypothetical protein
MPESRQPDLGPATIQAGGPPRRKTPSRILRRQVYARDGWRCKKCRLHSPDGRDFELHHIIEFSAGGSDEPDNLDTLCRMCHAEWTWIWTSSRAVSYERWLTLTPMILLYRTLLLATDGVESIHDEVERDMARLVVEMLQRSGLSRELVEQLLIRPRDIVPPTREEIDRLRGRAS